ncbi:MAG: hypothetical protein GY749_14550 [Desulfobacteraceae bacterium]|nr:hypothetical protein [Desulfobacteraceae bacterium]
MKTYFKEKIGNPALFTGRKKEMEYLLNWAEKTKKEISLSTAILSRRKTGKTAIMHRLFNILFSKNDSVVPFYFEIWETDQWLGKFAQDFFFTFIWQYIAFHSRNPEYIEYPNDDYSKAARCAKKEGLDHLIRFIESAQHASDNGNAALLWDIARDTPRFAARYRDECIVQMIDEFQFLNKYIFRDEFCKHRIENLAGSYLHTSEYKNAPLLVSGSWVGWLTRDLEKMLPGRFQFHYLENMPEEEAVAMILKYSNLEDIPMTEKTVTLMAGLTEGNPFYISSLFRSKYPVKDFTTEKGLLETLEFETLDKEGTIKSIWMEYALYAMEESNDANAKKMVLYLCKNREREVTRKEISDKLSLEMSDSELEKKLKILVRADIIEQGSSNSEYQGVRDNIFDKIFRGVYQKEIESFDTKEITNEYKALAEKLQKKHKSLMGQYSNFKGKFAEYLIIDNLKYRAYANRTRFQKMINGMPKDFEFTEYETVWSYSASPIHKRDIQVDIFARAGENEYSLIGEVKNRKAKFSVKEAKEFVKKAEELMELEELGKAVLFVFSINGFHKNTLEYLKKHGIAWTDNKKWLERRKSAEKSR